MLSWYFNETLLRTVDDQFCVIDRYIWDIAKRVNQNISIFL